MNSTPSYKTEYFLIQKALKLDVVLFYSCCIFLFYKMTTFIMDSKEGLMCLYNLCCYGLCEQGILCEPCLTASFKIMLYITDYAESLHIMVEMTDCFIRVFENLF